MFRAFLTEVSWPWASTQGAIFLAQVFLAASL